MRLCSVEERVSFPNEETEILSYWKDIKAFETSLERNKNKKPYTFYDGPPFASGLPHYGHILAGTIKDTVTRYAHMTGHHVERRFGWDTHGLPIEYEIDKTLGITSSAEVLKMGIDKYNAQCRSIVMRYAGEWRQVVTRLGRWIDFDNDYKTLDPTFMESVWWVFGQLYEKGLVYHGFKVMPYSFGCATPLSNFEANQNYKDVSDPAVIVNFPLVGEPETSILVWTTTPWTLPSNLAACVNPNFTYVKIQENGKKECWIVGQNRLSFLYPKNQNYKIIKEYKGTELKGLEYTPPFDYFESQRAQGAFRIVCDTYVTDDSGTGIVHQAPAFGEDDYRVCMTNGIIKKGGHLVCPVDADGRFTPEVPDFVGRNIKEADNDIIAKLKAKGRLVSSSKITHSVGHCWRSDLPLIYKAVPSWFVKVEAIKEQLIENNLKTYWVPDFVQEKRFANWLRDARDWAISRNRFWGTPLPLWVSDDGEEVVCISSVAQLEKLTGAKITDLHRESIDHLTIPSSKGKGVLRRTPEVFDCWFESGSMPYAQVHFPFSKTEEEFNKGFPADFIAEGIDQTRGWFYTLMVLSTALYNKPPFQNLIVNGLVLAADGKKMSKRLKNYPDPTEVVDKYGADALRMYLINSPVVRAENLRFQEEGVRDCLKDVLLPWQNAYRFFVTSVHIYEQSTGKNFVPQRTGLDKFTNVMDRWILASTQSLIAFVQKEMQAYRLYTVIPALVKHIEALTNWYVRFNRTRLKAAGDGEVTDAFESLSVLFEVLLSMCVAMAPFTPFIVETMYQNIKNLLPEGDAQREASVHFLDYPTPRAELFNEQIEFAVKNLQSVILLGRTARERRNVSLKQPIVSVTVICENQAVLDALKPLDEYIKSELNVRSAEYKTSDPSLARSVALDFRTLGKRLGKDMQPVKEACDALTNAQVSEFVKTRSLTVLSHTLALEDVSIKISFAGANANPNVEAGVDGDIVVVLDISRDDDLVAEGLAREFNNRVQKLRKKAHLQPTDPIEIFYSFDHPSLKGEAGANNAANIAELQKALEAKSDFIRATLQRPVHGLADIPAFAPRIAKEITEINDVPMYIELTRPTVSFCKTAIAKKYPSLKPADIDNVIQVFALCDYTQLRANQTSVQKRVNGETFVFTWGVEIFADSDKKN